MDKAKISFNLTFNTLDLDLGHTVSFPVSKAGMQQLVNVLKVRAEREAKGDTHNGLGTKASPSQSQVDQMVREYTDNGGIITVVKDKPPHRPRNKSQQAMDEIIANLDLGNFELEL